MKRGATVGYNWLADPLCPTRGGFPRGASSVSYRTPSVRSSRLGLGSLGSRRTRHAHPGGPDRALRDRLDPAGCAPDADTRGALPAGALSRCPQPPVAADAALDPALDGAAGCVGQAPGRGLSLPGRRHRGETLRHQAALGWLDLLLRQEAPCLWPAHGRSTVVQYGRAVAYSCRLPAVAPQAFLRPAPLPHQTGTG